MIHQFLGLIRRQLAFCKHIGVSDIHRSLRTCFRPVPEPPAFKVMDTFGFFSLNLAAASFASGNSADEPDAVIFPLTEDAADDALPEDEDPPHPANPAATATEAAKTANLVNFINHFLPFLSHLGLIANVSISCRCKNKWEYRV